MRIGTAGVALAGLAAVAAPRAVAQEWHGAATIYGWLPAVKGQNEGPDGEPVVDITGPERPGGAELRVHGRWRFRRDELGFMFDGVYADLGFDGEAERVDVSGSSSI